LQREIRLIEADDGKRRLERQKRDNRCRVWVDPNTGMVRSTLALDPELLFLDEPTAGLDPIGAAAFDELTRSLQRTMGLTVFLITHDLDTLYAICDRVAVLADQKVIAVGTIDELLALDHPWIQDYFNGPRGRAATATQESADRRAEAHAKPGTAH
jgi:phospholipid/cholesterol/gamma-HCH transport system ATP-binding protein